MASSARDDDTRNAWLLGIDGGSSLSPGDRVAYHPARVLAECEAKRRIVEAHGSQLDARGEVYWSPEVRYLAQVYSDHPDYDEAWRP